jgi:hypothetical protein
MALAQSVMVPVRFYLLRTKSVIVGTRIRLTVTVPIAVVSICTVRVAVRFD